MSASRNEYPETQDVTLLGNEVFPTELVRKMSCWIRWVLNSITGVHGRRGKGTKTQGQRACKYGLEETQNQTEKGQMLDSFYNLQKMRQGYC